MYFLLKRKIFQPAMLVYQKIISFTFQGTIRSHIPYPAVTFEVDDDFPAETRLVGYVILVSWKPGRVPRSSRVGVLHRPRMPELMANAFQKLGFERVPMERVPMNHAWMGIR